MKSIKYLAMSFVLAGFSTTAMAQDGTKADVAAVKEIIKSNPADIDKQLKAYLSKNKKNAENLVDFGRAFYEVKDYDHAASMASMALAAKKNAFGPAYLLLGDIAAMKDDPGVAAQNYEQAILFNKEDPEPYRRYASVYRVVDPVGAVNKLEELRVVRPDFPVDALIGHINYLSKRYPEAIDAFDKVPAAQMQKMDIIEYGFSAWVSQKYDKGVKMLKQGLQNDPKNGSLNRLALYCYTENGQFAEALERAEVMFNQIDKDSVKLNYRDYVYYGNALNGAKQHQEAIDIYKKALDQEFDSQDKRAGVIKQLADAYKGVNDYENALKYYDEYLAAVSAPTLNDFADLGRLYVQYASKLEGDAKTENLKKAEKIYADLAEKNPDALEYSLFWRGRVGTMLDPDASQGIAQPFYEQLWDIIVAKAEQDKSDVARMKEAGNFLMVYYLKIKDDVEKSKVFAGKIIEIDPTNETAAQIVAI
jgi:tetratricopeptide (TPR) repeat protein